MMGEYKIWINSVTIGTPNCAAICRDCILFHILIESVMAGIEPPQPTRMVGMLPLHQ